MKKLFLSLTAILFGAAILTGCQSDTPKSVAEKFLTAMTHYDYATAKKYGTEETKKQLDQKEESEKRDTANMAARKSEAQKLKVTVKEPVMTNDSMATVEYTVSDAPTSTKKLKLVKRSNKWLAEWSKMDDLMNAFEGMNNGNNMPMTPEADMSTDSTGATNMGAETPSTDTPVAPPVEAPAR